MTIQTFHCPSCQASLEHDDSGTPTVRCPYCNTSVIVPEALRKHVQMHRRRASGQQTNSGQLDALAEIGALIARGRKIEAIKTYRETFGVGLKEAKEAVEALERGESVQM